MSSKWISLTLFVVQNSILIIGLRACSIYSSHTTLYIASTVVMFTEILKFILSTIMVFVYDADCKIASFKDALIKGFVDDGADCMKLLLPAILYCIQNNLQYVIESAPLFLVLYQSKIITTAVFYSTLLSRRLSAREWLTVAALAVGVSMVESSQHDIQPHHASNLMGILCVFTACMTSGFAGVYFEKILKSSRSSIWMINLQMSLLSSFFCVSLSLTQDTEEIIEEGVWKGYNVFVVAIIILQAVTGLVVALVVKYSDNIHKGFANSFSIVISNTIDAFLFSDTDINQTYTTGTLIVIASCWYFSSLNNNSHGSNSHHQGVGGAGNSSGDSSAGTDISGNGSGGSGGEVGGGASVPLEEDIESHDCKGKGSAASLYSRWWMPWTTKYAVT